MKSLAEMKCVPCQGGEPTVTEEEMAELKPKVPEWQVVEQDGVKRLKRSFKFDDFAQALAFTDQVAKSLRRKAIIRCW
jgi:4a-hydroxytetrahydrobiopterin dehydratase